MYQQDLQNGLLHASKMAEALVRLQQQQGSDCVLPAGDISRQTTDSGRRLSYDQPSPPCVDFSHGRQIPHPATESSSACTAGGLDGGNQSLFVVITRSEYDAMRQELASLKQALCELKSSIDQDIRQLRADSRMLKQHVGTCMRIIVVVVLYLNVSMLSYLPRMYQCCLLDNSPTDQLTVSHRGLVSSRTSQLADKEFVKIIEKLHYI